MDESSSASKTALMVCAYRARATRWPKPVMTDPWAEAIAGPEGHEIAKRFDQRWPHMEIWLALRVAFLDRLVHIAVDRLDIRQIVVLGAGYDTRAARLPRAGVTFFEVDHPATQAAKRERLAATGFRMDDPALVIWEGVVPYLTEAAVRATATTLAKGLSPRSLLAFDFVGKKLAEGVSISDKDRAMRDYVGDLGEPIRFGSNHIIPLLGDCGYRWMRQLSFDELCYELIGDYAREREFRFQHMALASVTPPRAGWP